MPVWSSNGIVCTGETYKAAVKLTFGHGADDTLDAAAFRVLVKAAVVRNAGAKKN